MADSRSAGRESVVLPGPLAEGVGWPWSPSGLAAPDGVRRWPRITLVTPSLNQGAYIEETIRSVLLQEYAPLEYFVVDGGSTDGTKEILKHYSGWISDWVSEPDRGQSDALNKGLRRATGELLAFLNSDDVLEPGALHAIATTYLRDPRPRMLLCGGVSHWRDGEAVYRARPTSFGGLRHWFDEPQTLPQQGCFWTPEVWRFCGPFPEHLHLTFDRFFFTRVAALDRLRFQVVDMDIARFRLHNSSKTGRDWERFAAEWEATKDALEQSLPSRARRRLWRERREERLARGAESLAACVLRQGSQARAAAVLWRGFLENPALLISRPVMGAVFRLLRRGWSAGPGSPR